MCSLILLLNQLSSGFGKTIFFYEFQTSLGYLEKIIGNSGKLFVCELNTRDEHILLKETLNVPVEHRDSYEWRFLIFFIE